MKKTLWIALALLTAALLTACGTGNTGSLATQPPIATEAPLAPTEVPIAPTEAPPLPTDVPTSTESPAAENG